MEHKHNLDRTNIGLELTRLNFRGRNERLIATAQLGYSKYFDFSYKIPYIDKSLKHGIYIGLQYITGREINYKTEHNKIVFIEMMTIHLIAFNLNVVIHFVMLMWLRMNCNCSTIILEFRKVCMI